MRSGGRERAHSQCCLNEMIDASFDTDLSDAQSTPSGHTSNLALCMVQCIQCVWGGQGEMEETPRKCSANDIIVLNCSFRSVKGMLLSL